VNSILFVRLSAMGDLVQSLGAVRALHDARPDWRLTFVTQTTWAPLLRGFPGLARVVEFERNAGLAGVARLRRALRADRYDVAVDLQGNWKSAFVAWLAGAAARIGIEARCRQEPTSRWLLHRTVAASAPVPHPARCAWDLVRDLAPNLPFAAPRLEPIADELAHERTALAALGIDVDRPFRVVVVTEPGDVRSLLPVVVASETRASPMPVVHVLGPDAARLPDVAGVATLRHGREPRRLVALGALVAAAGGEVLGPDQGATHVLAAAGARCFVWFGAQDPRRTAPPASVALRHPTPPACSPCRRRTCDHPDGRVCMDFGRQTGAVVELGLPASDPPGRR